LNINIDQGITAGMREVRNTSTVLVRARKRRDRLRVLSEDGGIIEIQK
jgi:hypothetical protein